MILLKINGSYQQEGLQLTQGRTLPKQRTPIEVAWHTRDSRARKKKRYEPGFWVERERVQAVLERWIREFEARKPRNDTWRGVGNDTGLSGREALAESAGISIRTLYRLLGGRGISVHPPRTPNGLPYFSGCERFVSVYTVDQIMTRIGWQHILYADPPEGFADVYFHPTIVDAAEDPGEQLRLVAA